MNEQETTTDIIAEMDRVEVCADGEPCLRDYARRLEAAHKREVGDCAKLREALENMVRAETHGSMERDDLCGRCLEKMFARCNHDGTCWVDKAITALAAPPRNCDRFGSSTQARAEWYKTEVLPRVEGVVSGVEPPFVDWLFAPATEKEGGNNGNE